MIRIVGIQRSDDPSKEFILLQNQGGLRVRLTGHLVASDQCLKSGTLHDGAYAFNDDTLIQPGVYIMLVSGVGAAKWMRSKDGSLIYHAYANSTIPIWSRFAGSIHLLNTQHTYAESTRTVLLR